MTARQATNALQHTIFTRCNVSLSFDDANTLRRAELALQRWGEQECGDSNEHASWCIERDEDGKPYHMRQNYYSKHGQGQPQTIRYRIPDRERGALRRIAEVCKRNGLHYFHQTDPRGCALYVSNEPLTDSYYSRGVACCAN